MPAPTPSWNLVRCYGTWNNQDGTKKQGSYRVTIPQRVTSAVDDAVIPPGIFASGALNTGTGPSLDVQIPATDDPDISPVGFSVQIEVMFSDGTASETFFVKPSVSGPAVNLRQYALPSGVPVPETLLHRGVPGGLAELDRDGDVINAAGQKVVGGGGGGTGDGTVTTANITDATTTGRNLIKSVDAAAARALLGAGTSNLALGTTSSTAKAGNWAPGVADITASGTRSSTTFLRGDGAWQTPSGLTDATALAKGAVQLAGDLAGTAAAPTVPGLAGKQDANAQHTLAQLAPGAAVVIDYYKPVFGAANAWPTSRPTNRTDLDITWRGPTDPGNIMLVGDMFDLTGA